MEADREDDQDQPPDAMIMLADEHPPATAERAIVLDCERQNGARFLAYFPFERRPDREKCPEAPLTVAEHLRAAVPGVRWDKRQRAYVVPAMAANLRPLAEFAAAHGFTLPVHFEAFADKLRANALATLRASRALSDTFAPEGLGGTLLPYQRAGAAFLVHYLRALLADEMGLGKTVQVLAALQHLRAFPAVVVCPAALIFNWQKECNIWLPHISTEVITDGTMRGGAKLTIVSYKLLSTHVHSLRANGCEAAIGDELHYCKNRGTIRYKAAAALFKGLDIRFGLSGTPMENFPIEMVPLLDLLGRTRDVGGFWHVAKTYCGAVRRQIKRVGPPIPAPAKPGEPVDDGKRWDMKGRGNVREFGLRLRATCMIRRLKRDVLAELPPKRRVYVPLPLSNQKEYDFARKNCLAWMQEQALKNPAVYRPLIGLPEEEQLAALARIAHAAGQKFKEAEELVKITALQGLSAAGKLPAASEWIRNLLETGENLVLFANRRAVIDALATAFGVEPLTGSTSSRRRSDLVAGFQAGKSGRSGRLFLANLKAGGTGLTLTAASNVAFLEGAWNPALLDQAEDRCHRIGQRNAVTAWYLMGKGTIDYHLRDVARDKRATAVEMLA